MTWSPINIAVYSNRKTFQFCQKWLQLAVLEDHAAFKGLPVSVLMATDHELDDFDKNVLIKGKGLDSSKTTIFAWNDHFAQNSRFPNFWPAMTLFQFLATK